MIKAILGAAFVLLYVALAASDYLHRNHGDGKSSEKEKK